MNLSAIYVLWLREVRSFTRAKFQLVAALSQPVLWLVGMGFGLGGVFNEAGRGSYLQFVTPGIVAMTVLFPAVFSGIGLLMDRQFGFLKETLVAPVPRFAIVLGRTFGVATVAFIQGAIVVVICFIFGFRPTSLALAPAAVAFIALIALLFAGLGLIVGSALKSPQGFTPVMNFLVMPLFFLSGAFYPLDNLPIALTAVTYVNPLSYGVDGLRSVLIAQQHFGAPLDAAVLILLTLALIAVGAWRFSKIEA